MTQIEKWFRRSMICLTGISLLIIPFGTYSKATTLNLIDSLKKAKTSALELEEARQKLKSSQSVQKKFQGIYDSKIGVASSFFDDKTENQSRPMDEIKGFRNEVFWEKLFPTGTTLKTTLKIDKNEYLYPSTDSITGSVDANDPVAVQAAQTQAAFFEAQKVPVNPEHLSNLEIEVSQPLWRNFWGAEFEYQENMAKDATIGSIAQYRILEQGIQAETEQLFWNMYKLEKQTEYVQEIHKKSLEFFELMKKRARLGRAEEVDVATARSQTDITASQIINLKMALESVQTRLEYRILGKESYKTLRFSTFKIEHQNLGLPFYDIENLVGYAFKNRHEFSMYRDLKASLQTKMTLTHEKDKSDVRLFAKFGFNGLDESVSDSLSDLSSVSNSSYAIGLKWSKTLGSDSFDGESMDVMAQIKELEVQEHKLKQDLRREINLAWIDKKTGENLLNQSRAHINSLKRQIRAEEKRYKQARSEEIVKIKYEIDMLNAHIEEIQAFVKIREAEAKIRMLCHAYEKEQNL